ncbi:catalase [Rhizobiales bacterium GAS191]|nr:catalase [Rhizobiales bacterium GAS191]
MGPNVGADRSKFRALALIGMVVGAIAALFAYSAGWLGSDRLTPARIVDALSERGGDPIGHRRNHAKGICFTGIFVANGAASALTIAPVLRAGSYRVIGRFAIATGNPTARDATGRVRSMAIRIVAPDGQEWRSGMNSSPNFGVSTPEAFYEQTLAMRVDPKTGEPDPQALQRFAATHPESAAFYHWAETSPWTSSFADETYNSLNAFIFVDSAHARHAVRWTMVPTVAPIYSSHAELAQLLPDFLEVDLKRRLTEGPLRWHLVVTVAAPQDPTDDATKAWPAAREHLEAGTLVISQAEDEVAGPCRDFNYDPLVLPAGIEPSDDPLLPARSSAYANSFDRRASEASHYADRTVPATGAVP